MSFNASSGISGATDVALVNISNPVSNKDVLTYNTSLQKWQDIPANAESYTYQYTGDVGILTGAGRVYLEADYEILSIRASVGTAPTGAPLKIDVSKNGTTIYTNQGLRPSISAGAFTATGNSPAITTFASGDYMTVDVDQVGSTIPGADLVVVVRLRRI